MTEPTELSELRPAPGAAPIAVLWMMIAIAIGGVVLLVMPEAPNRNESVASALGADKMSTSVHHTTGAASAAR